MRKKGFTLIELLVVISIIALLLSILMPALTKVKQQAQFVVCGSNLKQVGVAGLLYTVENDEFFSIALEFMNLTPSTYTDWRCRWHDEEMNVTNNPEYAGTMWQYLENQNVVMCPLFKSIALQDGEDHTDHNPAIPVEPQYAFSQNAFLGPLEHMERPIGSGDYPYDAPAYDWVNKEASSKRVSHVRRPAKIFYYSEEGFKGLNLVNYPFLPEQWGNDTLNDTGIFPWWNGPGNTTDTVGSFHKTSRNSLEQETKGLSNAVFADGHIENMYPWQTQSLGSSKIPYRELEH